MNMGFKNMLLWVLPLVIFISVQPLKAQDSAVLRLESTDTVDVCGNDKRVIIAVWLGNVVKSDSLLYFDIELKYDPKKVKFNQILTSGTLSEQFSGEIAATGEFAGVGYARAYAGSFKDIPVSGNKPLIAFLGTSLVECADTSIVALSSLDIEFKRTIADTQSAYIIAREKIAQSRVVSLTSLLDTVSLNDTNQIEKVNFAIKGSAETKVSEGILKVDYNHASFKVSQILPLTTNIEILKVDSIDSGIEISFKALDTIYQAEREIQASFERIKDTNELSFAKAYIESVNTCSCVSFLKDTVNITVKNTKRIINTINDNKNAEINSFKVIDNIDSWIIEAEGKWEVSLYSVLGQLKGTYQNTGNSIIIGKNSLETGVYLLVLKNQENHSQEIRIFNK